MTIGERIREERKSCGISMAELGQRIGVTAAAVSRYELGQRELTIDTIERIANALGIHVFDLVGIGTELDKRRITADQIEPNPDKLTPEKKQVLEEILTSDARNLYDMLTDGQKNEFWDILATGREPAIFYNKSSYINRIEATISKMTEEGQRRVADYAEDILPRYRAETTPESPPAPQEGTDTTSTPDAPETLPEGE